MLDLLGSKGEEGDCEQCVLPDVPLDLTSFKQRLCCQGKNCKSLTGSSLGNNMAASQRVDSLFTGPVWKIWLDLWFLY